MVEFINVFSDTSLLFIFILGGSKPRSEGLENINDILSAKFSFDADKFIL